MGAQRDQIERERFIRKDDDPNPGAYAEGFMAAMRRHGHYPDDDEPEDYTSEDKPRDLHRVDPEIEKGKRKKLLRELARLHGSLHEGIPAVLKDPAPPSEDGTSERQVHDGVVPYEDRPEDDVQSMPMASTVPCEAEAAKSAMNMAAERGPGEHLPSRRVMSSPSGQAPPQRGSLGRPVSTSEMRGLQRDLP